MLPQALRHALPAMTNDFVALLKDSSLVSTITVMELTKRTTIAAVDLGGDQKPGLQCAARYHAMSLPLSELARRLERRLVRDQRPLAL
jgi:polar amino acid transport system substrate-binding protein